MEAPTSFDRETALAHGGGCGCKLSPAVLREILSGMPAAQVKQVLGGDFAPLGFVA